MQWSPQQAKALTDISRWLKEKDSPIYRLFGYAGTGKSTIANEIAKDVKGKVLYATYTGKAAHVLRQKGCPTATTIHQLIYKMEVKNEDKLSKLKKKLSDIGGLGSDIDLEQEISDELKYLKRLDFVLNLDSPLCSAKLLIIDECSMVNNEIAQDLLSFKIPIIVLGDPAQLPPVHGTGFFTEVDPDSMLTEVHRQAIDNPIIYLATQIREGTFPKLGDYGESKIVNSSNKIDVSGFDQVLVGTNKTRNRSNRRIRTQLGNEDPLPEPGDKVICLRNNHKIGILNGSLWSISDLEREDIGEKYIDMEISSMDDDTVLDVSVHTGIFLGETPEWRDMKLAEQFDYGYAITVHKSQGSQWDSIVLVDESYCFREDKFRWLYTGVTRAAENITIIRRS